MGRKISQLAELDAVTAAAVIPLSQSGVTYKAVPSSIASIGLGIFNVRDPRYGATGDGTTDDTAAVQAADTAAAAVGGTVYFPPGTYACTSLTISSGVTWEGAGDASVIKNCLLTAEGTPGAEIELSSATTAGATTIPIASTGMDGQWIRLASVINCGSSDAGEWQLGDRQTDNSFLAEFVRIQTGGASSATIYGQAIFPYSDTPGGDSGALTASVAYPVTFHANARLRRLKFLGRAGSNATIIDAQWCRNLVLDDVTLDVDDAACSAITMVYCLDCRIVGSRIVGDKPATSSNQVLMRACQDCVLESSTLEFGNQAVDITYPVGDDYRGGPSINCGATKCHAVNTSGDGFTSHPGCYKIFFDGCWATGANGVRIRSRGDRVSGCSFTGKATGLGVYIHEAAVLDCLVTGNHIQGYLHGIEFQANNSDYSALAATLGGSTAQIVHNQIAGQAGDGVLVATAFTSAELVGPTIAFNEIRDASDGVQLQAYNNGARVVHNRIFGCAQSGIEYGANTKRLHISDNHVYDCSAEAVLGPGTASMMTDATTFPSGESEAELYLGPIFTNEGTVFSNTIADQTAYIAPRPRPLPILDVNDDTNLPDVTTPVHRIVRVDVDHANWDDATDRVTLPATPIPGERVTVIALGDASVAGDNVIIDSPDTIYGNVTIATDSGTRTYEALSATEWQLVASS